jgi:hypothetical protein
VVIITLLISIFGISAESSWLYSIELWSYGTIAEIVGEYGIGKAISTISIAIVLFGALSALAIWLLNNKKLWKHKS